MTQQFSVALRHIEESHSNETTRNLVSAGVLVFIFAVTALGQGTKHLGRERPCVAIVAWQMPATREQVPFPERHIQYFVSRPAWHMSIATGEVKGTYAHLSLKNC